ncbi:hypothetical protein CJ030_MR2G000724 [Morella rubra]|uniref:Knottins-like domain-containing protein n=1 Tax=Morella rubra TaxID=262757 RepID=A0A6A1WWU8_9ROSI|nr:hypothetical protein CJ030_MR5G003592 [Morella rubra]KAB1228148.1 hypothetical protein CJ030_MR2G000724 [Morella rubra]
MAESPDQYVRMLPIFILFILIANAGIGMCQECSRLSQHWHKMCLNKKHCNKKCRGLEGAESGTCSIPAGKLSPKCYCNFKC